jgi:hypothetical protein
MESRHQKKTTFGKLIVVGTVAAVLAVAALLSGSAPSQGVNFIGSSSNIEVEQAYVEFLAKYGKTYSSKTELTTNFDYFAKNYELVKAHNSRPDRLFTMELN